MEDLLLHLYSHNIIVKTFHFTTTKYGHHKICDKYLDTFTELLDKYMETSQGLHGKINIKSMNFSVQFPSNDNIGKYMDSFITYINKIKLEAKEGCLVNILDDIIQNSLQFKYLLTFN